MTPRPGTWPGGGGEPDLATLRLAKEVADEPLAGDMLVDPQTVLWLIEQAEELARRLARERAARQATKAGP